MHFQVSKHYENIVKSICDVSIDKQNVLFVCYFAEKFGLKVRVKSEKDCFSTILLEFRGILRNFVPIFEGQTFKDFKN